jgi:hypothetical protein
MRDNFFEGTGLQLVFQYHAFAHRGSSGLPWMIQSRR